MSGRTSPAKSPDASQLDAAAISRVRTLIPPLLGWFQREARDLPWRHTLDPYAIWISEIMLQQTQVKTVIPYYERWLRALPDIAALANAPQEKVLKLWEGLGYYTRARNLQTAAQQIRQRHGGQFPRAHSDILELQGIGRYTAGAIASIAFNQPQPILDGNVIRVLTRVFGIGENPKEKAVNTRLWALATSLVESAGQADFAQPSDRNSLRFSGPCSALNQSLMELGALVCTPQKPGCLTCPLQKRCVAFREGLTESLPNLGERVKATAREFHAFVLRDGDRFLISQRPAGVVNAHLWEFPNVEVTVDLAAAPEAIAAKSWGWKIKHLEPLTTVRHTITRYRITVRVHQANISGRAVSPVNGHRWVEAHELEKLAFTSAHRRIARAALSASGI